MKKKCKKCDLEFNTRVKIKGRTRNLCNRQYCLICSPFGKHNTKKLDESNGAGETSLKTCKTCAKVYEYSHATGHGKTRCNSCITQESQQKKRKFAIDYYGGKCSICGYDKCQGALEFHHLKDKAEMPSYIIRRWSWEKTKEELDKCLLVCANCHREIHDNQIDLEKHMLLSDLRLREEISEKPEIMKSLKEIHSKNCNKNEEKKKSKKVL